MEQETYLLSFDGATPEEASRYLEELRASLLSASKEEEDIIKVQPHRDDPNAMDFGTTLTLIPMILGTPAAAAIAAALGNWLKMRRGACLTLKTAEGEVLLKNITSQEAVTLAERLFLKH